MAIVFRLPAAQVVDANGNPLSGARLRFYERGTTTPKNVFSDEGLTTPISQPVIANSAGQWPQIYMSADRYRVQLHTAAEVLVADYDNFDPGQPVSATAGVLPLALGGTGVTTLSALQSLLGLGAASNWADIASGATTDLGAGGSSNLRVTGTTNITSFGTAASGTTRTLRFASSLILTHNATSLILPTAANITTAADDTAIAVSLGGGNWIVVDYQRATGRPLAGATIMDVQAFVTTGAATWTKPANASSSDLVIGTLWGAGGGGNATATGGGGGAGVFFMVPAGNLGATVSMSIGAGGGLNANGGNTSFANITAYGGAGASNATTAGGGGGWLSAGSGGNGGGPLGGAAGFPGGANSGMGGGGGAATTSGGGGGASAFGGGGGGFNAAGGASFFGGGGGGSTGGTSVMGGAGGGTGVAGAQPGGGGGINAAGGNGFARIFTIRVTGV